MEKLYGKAETGCCPRFDPKPWDEKTVTWKGKLFIREKVRCFFHIPLGFSSLMVADMELIKQSGALAKEPMMLMDQCSLFSAVALIAVSKPVPGKAMEKVSGTFLSKVFEGPYKDSGKWVREMEAYVAKKRKKMGRLYFFYTMCPSCAKHYGKNYTVLLARI